MLILWVLRMPIARAAPEERSKVRPEVKGPRSFTVTRTVVPVLGFPIKRHVPNGRVLCAAVSPSGLKACPEAVRCPLCSLPYQLASTCGHGKARGKHEHCEE
jgi:hypothetical protein